MKLYRSTMRATLINAIMCYKEEKKMHPNFEFLKSVMCKSKGLSLDISIMSYIRLIGTIYAEKNMMNEFHDIIRKSGLINQVYAKAIYEWKHVNKFRCETNGIEHPEEYTWVLGKDNKYHKYERIKKDGQSAGGKKPVSTATKKA